MARAAGGTVDDLLSEDQIRHHLGDLPGWRSFANGLHKEFRYRGFRASIAFVDRLAEQASALGHHPDIEIHSNRVIVSLTTHDAGGVTSKDVELAKAIERVSDPDA